MYSTNQLFLQTNSSGKNSWVGQVLWESVWWICSSTLAGGNSLFSSLLNPGLVSSQLNPGLVSSLLNPGLVSSLLNPGLVSSLLNPGVVS